MRPDWDKITEEAFSSDEDHVFSVNYLRRRDELISSVDKAESGKRRRISVKHRRSFGMAATAAALILIPAATIAALNLAPKGGSVSSLADRHNANVTDVTVPGTEVPTSADTEIVYENSSGKRLSKSDIYYLLRYSQKNYDRVSGELVDCREGLFSARIVKFACDLENTHSYTQSLYLNIGYSGGLRVVQEYEKSVTYATIEGVDNYSGSGSLTYLGNSGKPAVRDLNRMDTVDYSNSPEAACALSPASTVLPMLDAAKYLTVYSDEHYIGRDCFVIKGDMNYDTAKELGITEFVFCIDRETGVLLKYLAYDFNGDCVQTMLMRNIAFDSKAEKVRDLTSEEIESSGTETLPEVMAVRGINGCTGFIKVAELIDGSNISIGGESEGASEKCIDVYDNDLHTAIDKIIL